MSYSAEDYAQIQKETNEILAKLETVEDQGWVKKGELIERFVEKSRILLNAGKLDVVKKEFCSYITAKLEDRGVGVSTNGRYYALFSDDEKEISKSRTADKMSTNISSGQTVDEKFRESVLSKPKKDDEYTKHFDMLNLGADELKSLISSMLEKYNESDELAQVMKESIDLESVDIINLISTISLARKNIDDRNKWGNYEKLIAQFLINVGETKAELAKKLNYCSKYASIGIERNEELTRYWHFLGKCLHCGTDIKDEKDKLIEKYLKGEELDVTKGILQGY